MANIFWNAYIELMDSQRPVDVLAIGDSWFHYPFDNLVIPLSEVLERPTIYVIGESGARADELARGSWLARFTRMLDEQPAIRLVCISAGGNDFAGTGDLDDRVLQPDCSAASALEECFRANQPAGVMDEVATAYATLIAAVDARVPGATVLVHNYDYAIPNGRTLPGLKSWLKLPMDNTRVPTPGAPLGGLRREVVRELIDGFTLAIDALETPGDGTTAAAVELVWSAGTLSDGQWANELHPTPAGFDRIARQCWAGPARRALGLP